MEKEDYYRIATKLADIRATSNLEVGIYSPNTVDEVAHQLANMFERNDQNFDSEWFINVFVLGE